jgi:hypothetical protein
MCGLIALKVRGSGRRWVTAAVCLSVCLSAERAACILSWAQHGGYITTRRAREHAGLHPGADGSLAEAVLLSYMMCSRLVERQTGHAAGNTSGSRAVQHSPHRHHEVGESHRERSEALAWPSLEPGHNGTPVTRWMDAWPRRPVHRASYTWPTQGHKILAGKQST